MKRLLKSITLQTTIAILSILLSSCGSMIQDARDSVEGDGGEIIYNDPSGNDIPAGSLSISGVVLNNGSEFRGVTMELSYGSAVETAVTDQAGAFSFRGLGWGSYTLRAKKEGYFFSPEHKDVLIKDTSEDSVCFYAGGPYWQKTYGGALDDMAYDIKQTADGGYAVAGFRSYSAKWMDFYIMKLDGGGNIEWEKNYGGQYDEEAYAVALTSDGGYALAGYTCSYGAGGADAWIVKIDSQGAVQWQRFFGGENADEARAIQQTSDGGYIVAGYTRSSGHGNSDMWIFKLDAQGNKKWEQFLGGGNNEEAYSVKQTSDGGYVAAGYTSSYGYGGVDVFAVKLFADGSLEWLKTYGNTGDDFGRDIIQTPDNGYAIAGYTDSYGAGGSDMWVVKINSSGDEEWEKSYGASGDEEAYSIRNTSDGGYVIAGSVYSLANLKDVLIYKLNAAGIAAWNKTYGSDNSEIAWSVIQTSSGGYALAGLKDGDSSDIWVLSLDVSGN